VFPARWVADICWVMRYELGKECARISREWEDIVDRYRSEFWDDLNEDLKDPEDRAAFEQDMEIARRFSREHESAMRHLAS